MKFIKMYLVLTTIFFVIDLHSNLKKVSNRSICLFNFAKNQGFINFFVCEGLFASGQNAETFLMPALIPVAEDLFCSRTSSDPASELEAQREVMLTMLIKLLPYSQVQYLTRLVY